MPTLTYSLQTTWHKSAPHSSLLSWTPPRSEWRLQENENSLKEAAQRWCHDRSLPSLLLELWRGTVLSFRQTGSRGDRSKDSRTGPRVAERPLFSLAFQSKHLEKHLSKYGHFHGAAGEQRETCFAKGPAGSIVHVPLLSKCKKGLDPAIALGTHF